MCGIPTPIVFSAVTALLFALNDWPRRWLLSGTPILTFVILLGASKGYRVAPFIPIWTLIATLNLLYAVSATSWLLYGLFTSSCYPIIFFSCLFQFDTVADLVRGSLRSLLKQLQFVNDKVAFFDIPALEIDTEVAGLMVVRGITMSLSSLTILVHGVEVGIKLSDDLEIAICTDTVTIPLFRRIEIGDVYANIKGGEHEMTFHELDDSTVDANGDAVMVTDTPLLRAAAVDGEVSSHVEIVKMTDAMTDGAAMKDSSAKAGLDSVTQLSPDDDKATAQYSRTVKFINDTSPVEQCRRHLMQVVEEREAELAFDHNSPLDMRAAICSQLHDKPSVPHPPRRSIRVTTLQNLAPAYVRNFMHRLPMLLRLLLNPLSYFHPISITSITAAGSGKWIKYMLGEKLFQGYGDTDAEIRRLEAKLSTWLTDANFALELVDITGLAQVPFLSAFDIVCYLMFSDVMAYRTLPLEATLNQVVRLGGADATFTVPSFLLPHHEHLLPPIPTTQDKQQLAQDIVDADGLPKIIQAEATLEQAVKDEANVKMSVHASLPACFDQELLNFIAALVKATKVVEMEKEPNAMDDEVSGFKDFTKTLHRATKESMKKAVVGGIINDKWIAKMVGKITKKLETAQGDVGYSGNIPVQLEKYRPGEWDKLASKLLG